MQEEDKIKSRSASGRVLHILSDSVAYGALYAISKLATLLILPITTRFLSNENYGILDTLTLFGTALIVIAVFGQEETIGRYYYEQNDEGKKKTITTALITTLVITVVLVVVCGFFSDTILTHLFGFGTNKYELFALLSYIPSLALLLIIRAIARWTFRKRLFLILNLCPSVLFFVLTYIFIKGYGIAGVFWAQTVSSTIFVIIGFFCIKDQIVTIIDVKHIKKMLRFGMFFMIAATLANLLAIMDRSIYTSLIGIDSLGTYAFASRYASFQSIAFLALSAAWLPVLYIVHKEKHAVATFNKTFYMASGIFSILMFIQIALSETFIWFIAPTEYLNGIPYIIPLTFGVYITGLAAITSIGTILSSRVEYSIIAIAVALVFFKFSTQYFAPIYGGIAIAYLMLAARIIWYILAMFIGYRLYPIRYKLLKPHFVMILSISMCFFFQHMPNHIPLQIALRSVLMLILCIVIWSLLVTRKDKKRIVAKIIYGLNKLKIKV